MYAQDNLIDKYFKAAIVITDKDLSGKSVFYTTGLGLACEKIPLPGIILFAHSAVYRIIGYGLKFTDDFTHTLRA